MSKPIPLTQSDFPHHAKIQTRWGDNDVYGHVNNVVYYAYFDTVVNNWLIEQGLLVIGESETIGLVVETGCAYFAPIQHPDPVTAGLRVTKIGSSSVRYEIGIFGPASNTACAQGHFVHVYVNEQTRRPTPLSDKMRKKLGEISV